MKAKYLLPHQFKAVGWILFFPFLLLGFWQLVSGYEPDWLTVSVPAFFNTELSFGSNAEQGNQIIQVIQNNIADEICAVILLLSAMLLVFSKERDEDEFIMKLRLDSIMWAALANGLILLFSIIFFYDFTFFYVMIFNLFLLFLLFIVRFHWVLRKFRKEAE